MDQDRLYINHILDAINLIEKYVADLTVEQFTVETNHQITRDAVVRQFQIIGEASKSLSDQFKKENTSLPWRDIGDMRNSLIHEYVGVNYDIVWSTIVKDLKPLLRHLKSCIE